jgi:hypothetical protein
MTRLGLTNTGHLNDQACETRHGKVNNWKHRNYKPRKRKEEKIFCLAKPFKMKLKKSEVEFRLLLQKFTVQTGVLGGVKSIYNRPNIS